MVKFVNFLNHFVLYATVLLGIGHVFFDLYLTDMFIVYLVFIHSLYMYSVVKKGEINE